MQILSPPTDQESDIPRNPPGSRIFQRNKAFEVKLWGHISSKIIVMRGGLQHWNSDAPRSWHLPMTLHINWLAINYFRRCCLTHRPTASMSKNEVTMSSTFTFVKYIASKFRYLLQQTPVKRRFFQSWRLYCRWWSKEILYIKQNKSWRGELFTTLKVIGDLKPHVRDPSKLSIRQRRHPAST